VPIRIKHIFEKEYMKKGYTKKEADNIFYAHQNKLKYDAMFKKKVKFL
jgi:hypothetical protein